MDRPYVTPATSDINGVASENKFNSQTNGCFFILDIY